MTARRFMMPTGIEKRWEFVGASDIFGSSDSIWTYPSGVMPGDLAIMVVNGRNSINSQKYAATGWNRFYGATSPDFYMTSWRICEGGEISTPRPTEVSSGGTIILFRPIGGSAVRKLVTNQLGPNYNDINAIETPALVVGWVDNVAHTGINSFVKDVPPTYTTVRERASLSFLFCFTVGYDILNAPETRSYLLTTNNVYRHMAAMFVIE